MCQTYDKKKSNVLCHDRIKFFTFTRVLRYFN